MKTPPLLTSMPDEDSDWSNLAFGLSVTTCSHKAGLHGADELTLARASPPNASELRPREKDFDADEPPSVFNLISHTTIAAGQHQFQGKPRSAIGNNYGRCQRVRSRLQAPPADRPRFEQTSIDWILNLPDVSNQCVSSSRSASPGRGCLLAATANTRPSKGCGSHSR